MSEYYIPEPPRMMFEYADTPTETVFKENLTTYVIDHFEFSDKGVLVHYKDIPFPRKGFPFAEAVASVNIVKRATMHLLKHKYALIYAPKRVLRDFTDISVRILGQYIMKPALMTPLASELQGTVYVFLVKLGIERSLAVSAGKVLGTIIQYDNAYLYRLQDLCSETTKEALIRNPRKEMQRLTDLFIHREKMAHVSLHLEDPIQHKVRYYEIVASKAERVSKLFRLLLLVPKVKRAFIEAIKHTDLLRMQYDEADRYWVSLRKDYDYQGLSFKERNHGMPQAYKIQI